MRGVVGGSTRSSQSVCLCLPTCGVADVSLYCPTSTDSFLPRSPAVVLGRSSLDYIIIISVGPSGVNVRSDMYSAVFTSYCERFKKKHARGA